MPDHTNESPARRTASSIRTIRRTPLITDIKLAPRNARGKVEYVATFSLMKPIDMTQSSGVLMYSVVNRGGGAAAASPEGHVSLVSGWQGDLVPTANNQTIQVPVAKNPDGTSITGPLVLRFTGLTGTTATLMIPRNQPSPYPPVTLDTSKASLVSAVSESATGVKSGTVVIPGSDWAFADCTTTPFPGKPDATRICVKNGFNPALLYELQYTAKDPLVLGIGAAATRDINSFFRYEKQDDAGTANPVAGRIRWGISEGSSQSGTFLRLFIQLGFNQDEQGRSVWDGSNPHIASRVIDLNRRFAMPGGTVSLYELGMEAPLWWEDWNDTPRGRGKAGLLDRCRVSNTCPKIMETFGSAEIWGLRASPMLVGTTAKADIPLPDNVRRYYFPGVTHGGGPGGFSTTTGPVAGGCDLPVNPAPAAPMRSALLSALTDWVTKGTPMPASRYPTIADGTLVPNTSAAMGFPTIPGKPSPENLVYPLLDYDLGSDFDYQDQSGFLTKTSNGEAGAAAAGAKGRCRRQRDRRREIAAADGAARHLHRMERDVVGPVQGADVPVRIARGRLHPVREDESRASCERRSPALARRAVSDARRIRAGPERGRALAGERRLPASGGCRRDDQTGRSQQRATVTTEPRDLLLRLARQGPC